MAVYLSGSAYITFGHVDEHFSLPMPDLDAVDIRLWNELRYKDPHHTITFAHHYVIYTNSVRGQMRTEYGLLTGCHEKGDGENYFGFSLV